MCAKLSDITEIKSLVREMIALKNKINESPGSGFKNEAEVRQYRERLTTFAEKLKTLPSDSDPDIVAACFAYESLRQAMTQKFNESKYLNKK